MFCKAFSGVVAGAGGWAYDRQPRGTAHGTKCFAKIPRFLHHGAQCRKTLAPWPKGFTTHTEWRWRGVGAVYERTTSVLCFFFFASLLVLRGAFREASEHSFHLVHLHQDGVRNAKLALLLRLLRTGLPCYLLTATFLLSATIYGGGGLGWAFVYLGYVNRDWESRAGWEQQ